MSSPAIKLVLLPGMDGTGDLYADFVSALPSNFETTTVRYPTDRCLSYLELGEYVRSKVPTSEPFTLVAESFSTPIAIQLAATNPTNLQGLVLCAGFATSPLSPWLSTVCFFSPILLRIVPPRFAIEHWLVGPNAPHSLLASVAAAISSVRPRVLTARIRAVIACDARAQLVLVATPILYLQPLHDRLVSRSKIEEMLEITSQPTVETVASPHLLFQREPRRSAELVARFAQSCRASLAITG
jgi:pimeloyl-ACP methyl ester carboxylesterase